LTESVKVKVRIDLMESIQHKFMHEQGWWRWLYN